MVIRDARLKLFPVVGPGETYIETPGIPILAEANKATTWTITEILPNSAPGAPDRVAATDPCNNR